MKRAFLAAASMLAMTSPVLGLTSPITNSGSITIRLNPFATIPTADGAPLDMAPAGDGTGRLFVATRNGKIDILSSTGAFQSTFLDMRNVVGGAGLNIYTGGEGGLLGLAQPQFQRAGRHAWQRKVLHISSRNIQHLGARRRLQPS